MDDEGEYDVRAVEARLARMEAARRSRAETARAAQISRPVVRDFELSAVDSSDDETSSGSEDEHGDGRSDKRMRDSLDLSMSTSVVLPRKPLCEALARAKPHENTSNAVKRGRCPSAPEENAGVAAVSRQTVTANQLEDMSIDYACTGRLVQRRRELERQSTEAPSPRVPVDQSGVRATPDVMASTRPLQTAPLPAQAVKAQTKIPSVAAARQSEPTEMPGDPLNAPGAAPFNRDSAQDNVCGTAPDSKTRALEEQTTRSRRSRVVPVAAGAQECGVNEAAIPEPARLAPKETTTTTSHAALQASSIQQPREAAATKPAVSAHLAKKSVSFTIAPPPAAAAPKPGYARAASSNQNPPSSATTQKVVEVKEPQDDADDIVSDLLTAEELRLRESLEKLSARLASLSTSRVAATRTHDPGQAPRDQPKLDSRKGFGPLEGNIIEAADSRTASYGGGAHVKPFQQTSPTTRASHAKRSELSSGVHKARVRTGGALVQDLIRQSEPADGKHKVVIKRDLAHLLF